MIAKLSSKLTNTIPARCVLWRGKKLIRGQRKSKSESYISSELKGITNTHLRNLIEFPKEFIQHVDQLSWGAVTGQPGEPHNVGVQDTVGMNKEGQYLQIYIH